MKQLTKQEKVIAFLKSFETADTASFKYISPNYIQHNLRVTDGIDGLNALFEKLPADVRVNIARIFQDGDYVITHTEYYFTSWRTGFDVFRFEDGLIAEHWDNLQATEIPDLGGRSMIDGSTNIDEIDKTQSNKMIVQNFIGDIIDGNVDKLPLYYDHENFIEHNLLLPDNANGLMDTLKEGNGESVQRKYAKRHRILGEGNFVLAISEGEFKGNKSAFFDLYRLANGKLVEHWDTIEEIPAIENHKNGNGKF